MEAAFATGLLPAEGRLARLARSFDAWVQRRFDRASSIFEQMAARQR